MQVTVSGQHFHIDQPMQEYVQNQINNTVKKYFDFAISAHIHFTKENYLYVCDLTVNDGIENHSLIRSKAETDDIHESFDTALLKIEKQLRKYKSKINNHHKSKAATITQQARKYIIDPKSEFNEETCELSPAIIAEKASRILSLSVSEAVMHMDFQNLPTLMFKHSKTGRINVVYYRRDGTIAWVDSQN